MRTMNLHVAVGPDGQRYQRHSMRLYRWCVLVPERQTLRRGHVWTAYSRVWWTAQSAPIAPEGSTVLPARLVTDPVEAAELAVESAEAHLASMRKRHASAILRNEERGDVYTPRDLQRRADAVATAQRNLETAQRKLEKLRKETGR